MNTGSRNPGQNRQATDDADPYAGANHRHASANAIAGDQATGKVTDIGSDEGHPGKERDPLKAETSRIAQVLRQPENIEPPDRVGQGAAQDNTPDIAVPGEVEIASQAALRGNDEAYPGRLGSTRSLPASPAGDGPTDGRRATTSPTTQSRASRKKQTPSASQMPTRSRESTRAAKAPPTLEPLSKMATARLRSSLGNHSATVLLAAGQLKPSPMPRRKRKDAKRKNRVGEPGKDVDHRPEDHGQRQAKPRSYGIKKNAAKKPRDRIRDLKGTEDLGQIGVAQMVLRRNHRRQNGECLAADVVGDRREKQRPDDPPPHAA